MTTGYLYCFSNDSTPGILKVGMTEQKINIELNEANCSYPKNLPTPYQILDIKEVANPKQKENILYNMLTPYKISDNTSFFNVSPRKVSELFHKIDAELFGRKWTRPKFSECFENGQGIRHVDRKSKHTWIGKYDSLKNVIMYQQNCYQTLSNFADTHNKIHKPYRQSANGWNECEYEVNGEWISTDKLLIRVDL